MKRQVSGVQFEDKLNYIFQLKFSSRKIISISSHLILLFGLFNPRRRGVPASHWSIHLRGTCPNVGLAFPMASAAETTRSCRLQTGLYLNQYHIHMYKENQLIQRDDVQIFQE